MPNAYLTDEQTANQLGIVRALYVTADEESATPKSTEMKSWQDPERSMPEFMDYEPISLEAGIGAIALGAHQGTIVAANSLYVTPHRENETVNPNTVHLGAQVQHDVSPLLGGKHFGDTESLSQWVERGGSVERTYITSSLAASEPLLAEMYEAMDA